MMKAGIPLTPGQARGGFAKTLEQGLTTVGIPTGQMQGRAIESWNRALLSEAAAPTGEQITAPGFAGIQQAKAAFSRAYESVDRAGLGVPTLPAAQTISQISLGAKGAVGLNASALDTTTGRVLKMLQRPNLTLGGLRSAADDLESIAAKNDTDPALSRAYTQFANVLDDLRAQSGASSPALDAGYAKFKTLQLAAASKGAPSGVFTPAQLQTAVFNRSNVSQRASGSGMLRGEADMGAQILGPNIPPVGPGTAERLASAGLAAGGIPYALGEPMLAAGSLASLAGLRAAYTTPGVRFLTGAYPWQEMPLLLQQGGVPGASGASAAGLLAR